MIASWKVRGVEEMVQLLWSPQRTDLRGKEQEQNLHLAIGRKCELIWRSLCSDEEIGIHMPLRAVQKCHDLSPSFQAL